MPLHEVSDINTPQLAWLRAAAYLLLCAGWLLAGNLLPNWIWPGEPIASTFALSVDVLFMVGTGVLIFRLQRTLSAVWEERRSLDGRAALLPAELQAIFNAAPMAIMLIRDRVIQQANQAAARMTGYSTVELTGMPVTALFEAAEVEANAARVGETLARGETFRDQTVLRRRDGSKCWLNVSGSTLDGGHSGKRGVWILEDVGAFQEAERKLRESEQRWQFALEGAEQGVWDWDLVNKRAYYSPRWHAMLGYEPHEITGTEEEWRNLIHPEDLPDVLAEQQRQLRGETRLFRYQYRMRRKDGEYLWILTRGRVSERDAEGRPIRMTGTNTDVSKWKAAERALENRERIQRTLVDALPVGMFQMDRDGTVIFINRCMLDMLGVGSEAEVVGRCIYDLIPDKGDMAKARARDQQVFAGNATQTVVEQYLVPRTGERHYLEIGNIPYRDAQGEITGLHGFVRDITVQVRADQALRNSERLYRSLGDALPMGLYRIDRAGRIQFGNNFMARMLGTKESDFVGRTIFDLIPEQNRALARERHHHAIETGMSSTRIEEYIVPGLGEARYQEITRIPVRDGDGAIIGVQGVFRDVTDQVLAERQLRLTSLVFESSRQAVVILDPERNVLKVNPAFSRITGFQPEEVLGRPPRFLMRSDRHDPQFYDRIDFELATTNHWEGEVWSRRKNGEVYPQFVTADVLRGEDGAISHYVNMYMDISERKASEEKIQYLARHDPLTELPNRTLLHDRVELAIESARRSGKRIALLYLDLDRFKNVNDSLGHEFGDKLLREAACRLSASVRASDTVSRHGGDEFVVMLPDVNSDMDARQIARKLIGAIAQPFVIEGKEIILTLSIGISMYPEDGTDIDTLLHCADTALYATKDAGRNHYRFYGVEMNTLAAQRLQTENELRHALERNELYLEYQPQIELDTQRVIGAEALLRWRHPTRGVVPPGEFIPIAEESGLIIEIGHWVIATACRQYAGWLAAGLPAGQVSVNVSGHQFRHSGFASAVLGCLEESGLDPRRLELEVTETVIMQGSEQVLAKLNQLAEIGVRLAIDDFGTGYSSLSYLKLFPIDRLKVDQGFVRGLPGDVGDCAIVRAVVGLGHNLELNVLAEGIETQQQLDFLRALGCHVGQGYFFSRPMAAEVCEKFMHNRMESQLPRNNVIVVPFDGRKADSDARM